MKKIERGFYLRKNLKSFEAYQDALHDEIRLIRKQIEIQIEKYRKRKQNRFWIRGTSITHRQMLIITGLFLQPPTYYTWIAMTWTDRTKGLNRIERLRGMVEPAEAFLKQIRGAVIPKRPVELGFLFNKL